MNPTVFFTRNIRFFFFSREEKRIYIHVRQLNKRAKFWVEPSIELAYNNGFNDSKLKEIKMEIMNNENTIRKNGICTLKAKVTMITSRGISLYVNGHKYYLPYNNYPWFREAKVADILNVEMSDEESLRWETLDIDLHLDSLIHPENYPLVAKMEAVIN